MTTIDATEALYVRWYGGLPPFTMRGVAFVEGERMLGMAGIFLKDGVAVLFADMTDEARKHGRALVRAGRKLLGYAARLGVPVYALAEPDIEAADRFLRHLGFTQHTEEILVWRRQQ